MASSHLSFLAPCHADLGSLANAASTTAFSASVCAVGASGFHSIFPALSLGTPRPTVGSSSKISPSSSKTTCPFDIIYGFSEPKRLDANKSSGRKYIYREKRREKQ
ncbi:hypothetical protein TraAM80_04969 [Trypanosoma rangeli]|uniref:Uncharacterized protein n=1 Tax=Trypanosoma rangeli TaxID=5698 RepID=A0A3R7KBG5_TRYRA|nr:uncharacterized protein TraAM80_04969 [Trypanosoma rangeli]RNF04837.1 hypothetical protein TraAM80_04969 [Trypanosoma rangeli]|eukprot:RNF04837.1 hypothetical protein TraAM80_04969 [Trypanosoma rangeli]